MARKPAGKPPVRPKQAPPGPGPVGRAVRAVIVGTVGWIWAFVWRLGLASAAVLAVAVGVFYSGLPEPTELFDGRVGGSVTLTDRHGSVFAWRGDQYGGALRASDASPHLIHAITAAEDRRFREHFGIDPRGIARAMLANLRAGRIVQGGSTLTQQVAKNVFLSHDRSIERKLKEVPMALALELKYSKDEILSIYLNRAYLGAGTYGFEAASQRYFGKSVRELRPAEAAMLAGLLRAPSRYAPTSDLDRAQGRASVIVRLMEEQGFLTRSQTIEALANPARLSTAAQARAGGYYADWVMETAPDYLTRDTTEDVQIATTFDPRLQRAAEAAVAQVFAGKVKPGSKAEVAVVVMTRDGAVRAMIGGRDPGAGGFNRAAHAKRQTGSAFKPVVYAAALEQGMSPLDTIVDEPLRIDGWSPENYDRSFRGPVTLTEALTASINTVAVRLSERAGRERVRELAGRMGITTPIAPGPAVALGTSEATLVEMTGVYAVIANRGRAVCPHGLRRLTLKGDTTPLLTGGPCPEEAVLDERTAGMLTGMMTAVVEDGTGRRATLPGWEVAGKTGTTQGARDAWFIGFTSEFVAGVWMGNDDNAPLTGVTGGGLPAEIWAEVMRRLHEGRTPKPLFTVAPPAPTRQPGRDSGDGGLFDLRVELPGLPRAGTGAGSPGFEPYTAGDR